MSAAESLAPGARSSGRHIMIVDDDPLFLESISQNLIDAGYAVEAFEDGASFLARLAEEPEVDLLLLDWKMPRMNGIEVLSQLRQIAPDLPVIFLTVLNDVIYEEAALLGGAVDFVEKSRSFSIVQQRIELVPSGPGAGKTMRDSRESLVQGKLRLDLKSHRAWWEDKQVELTLSEFGIVHTLAKQPGTDVPYREIYDVVRGEGFIAGFGDTGYRANVRSSIKRIRQKFRQLDRTFDCIENYPGFGYRWRES